RLINRLADCGSRRIALKKRQQHARMTKIEAHTTEPSETQSIQHQLLNFEIRFEARMAVDFGAHLNLLACGMKTARTRMQDAARIAKTRHALAVEQVRVNARNLWGGVCAQAQRAPR